MCKDKKIVAVMPACNEEKTLCKACDQVCKQGVFDAVIDSLTGETFSLVRCALCGMARTDPQPADLAPYYPSAYYGGRHGATAGFCIRRRLRLMGKGGVRECANAGMREKPLARARQTLAGKKDAGMRECANAGETPRQGEADPSREEGTKVGRLLDIGCGDGSFLLAAKAQGWAVTGVERFAEDARKKGLAVFSDVCELMSGRDGGSPASEPCPLTPAFDCITLWHSLEHIADPFALLGQVSALLAPGGQVIVAVPDFGGWQARCFGRHWLHLDVPRHLWHFTGPSLERAFEQAGLTIVTTRHQEFEYDLLGWSQSALNAVFKKPNVFFNWLTGKPTCAGKPMLVLQVVLGFILTGLAVPLVWLGSAFKRGGTLVVVGRRRAGSM